jgi:hypothetical protein
MRIERPAESDDEVRSNIPRELITLGPKLVQDGRRPRTWRSAREGSRIGVPCVYRIRTIGRNASRYVHAR